MSFQVLEDPEKSEWLCYLHGSKPGKAGGQAYRPNKGSEPNIIARFFMKHLLGCTWVKEREGE